MSQYSILSSMGVQNPMQIIGYTLTQPRPDTDVLRIRYERPKGSFLPVVRSYTFGRSQRTQVSNGALSQAELVYEVSPVLSKAILELDSIVQSKQDRSELKIQILGEIERLQEEFNAELNSLKQLVNRLEH
ncbi:DUF3461 family protein [uncultured Thiothrix sp.]|jgi:hypothetical protein|uniref:DUF3461 family protein n=1 Tax=uncultured Thiothrix sp. TaxID=223185 RepID=UPI002616476C|nr:DUF3461 family protein [uncultured Thiothrix sp.]HMT94205.1 DUF3461 family protein [Thiolinea sp.]